MTVMNRKALGSDIRGTHFLFRAEVTKTCFINISNFKLRVDLVRTFNKLSLSYYLANKRSLYVRFQSLEILTLIGEK